MYSIYTSTYYTYTYSYICMYYKHLLVCIHGILLTLLPTTNFELLALKRASRMDAKLKSNSCFKLRCDLAFSSTTPSPSSSSLLLLPWWIRSARCTAAHSRSISTSTKLTIMSTSFDSFTVHPSSPTRVAMARQMVEKPVRVWPSNCSAGSRVSRTSGNFKIKCGTVNDIRWNDIIFRTKKFWRNPHVTTASNLKVDRAAFWTEKQLHINYYNM